MSSQPVLFLPSELWIEIFVYLFDGLVDDWQFETFVNCSLVCKGFNTVLDWNTLLGDNTKPSVWKLIAERHSIPLSTDNSSDKAAIIDIRKVLCQSIIPNEIITVYPDSHVRGFSGLNYVASVTAKSFEMKLNSFGVGLLKRMLKFDLSTIESFKAFMKRIADKCAEGSDPTFGYYSYTELEINENLPFSKYELISQCERESFYPAGTTLSYEETKKKTDTDIFEFLKGLISGNEDEEQDEKISEIQVMREYIRKHCPIVVEFKGIYIGICISFGQVLITKDGKCIFFTYSADD